MKSNIAGLIILLFVLNLTISACRPPELEQAIIDYKGGRFDDAYEQVVKATEKHPDNEEAWYYMGELQGRKGDVEGMIASFDKSLSLKDTYLAEIEQAKRNYFSKFYNDGVSAYNAMIKIEDKESPEAQKKLDLVIDNFSKVVFIQNDYMANRLISIAYQFKNDDENSLLYLQKAVEAKPDTIIAYLDLGSYYLSKKEYDRAAAEYKKGLEIEPDNAECLIRYAESLDFADKKDEAIAAYKNAIEKSPGEKAIPFNLGLLLFKKANELESGDPQKTALMEDAVVYFKKAHEIDPEIKEVYDLLGTLLLQLERYDEARNLLEQGVEIFPGSASVWQNLSFLYAKTGEKEKAEEAFERSKQLNNQ